jgi:hypothetical protein
VPFPLVFSRTTIRPSVCNNKAKPHSDIPFGNLNQNPIQAMMVDGEEGDSS